MKIRTYTDSVARIHILCDENAQGWPDRYAIRFEGIKEEVVAEPGETPERTWALVQRSITYGRWAIRVGGRHGNRDGYATVYAGINPTQEQELKHQRDHISSCLLQIAHDPKVSGMARVKAFAAICDLHGFSDPCPENQRLNRLELLRAEMARRARK